MSNSKAIPAFKQCPRCGETKSSSDFYKNRSRYDGLSGYCKSCDKVLGDSWIDRNREKTREYARSDYQRNREKRAATNKHWQQTHPEKMRAYAKKWSKDNPEKVRERSRKGYAIEKEARRIARELKPKRTPEEIEATRLRNIENVRQWAKNNPEQARLDSQRSSNNYLARKKGAEGTYKQQDIDNLYTAQQGRCFYCGCELDHRFHVDHYIPLSKGGSNWPDNLRLACKPCNSKKRNKMPDEFIKRVRREAG